MELTTIICTPSHALLEYLHMGLPWYAAIPVSAFIVRGLLVTTVGSRVRSLLARYVALNPLRAAMSHIIAQRAMTKGGFKSTKHGIAAIKSEWKRETKALDSRWNCTLKGQIAWTVFQIPLFFVLVETIRKMAGHRDGILGLFANSVGLGSSRLAKEDDWGGSYSDDVALNPWYTPSLAEEGLLWFPDLMVPDPTGVLPYIVSGVMFANIYVTSNMTMGNLANQTVLSKRLRRIMLMVTLSVGPLCQMIPSCMLLYWASSSLSAMVWNFYLDWRYPLLPGWGPSKKPGLNMTRSKSLGGKSGR